MERSVGHRVDVILKMRADAAPHLEFCNGHYVTNITPSSMPSSSSTYANWRSSITTSSSIKSAPIKARNLFYTAILIGKMAHSLMITDTDFIIQCRDPVGEFGNHQIMTHKTRVRLQRKVGQFFFRSS